MAEVTVQADESVKKVELDRAELEIQMEEKKSSRNKVERWLISQYPFSMFRDHNSCN